MKPEKIEIELTLSVSYETAASCAAALNVYLRDHPGADVDVYTEVLPDGTARRKIHLRKEAEP